MSLIACPECKAQISNSARACPHCGYPLGEFVSLPSPTINQSSPQPVLFQKKFRPLGLLVGFSLVVLGIGLLISWPYIEFTEFGLRYPRVGSEFISWRGFPDLRFIALPVSKAIGLLLVLFGAVQLAVGSVKIAKSD